RLLPTFIVPPGIASLPKGVGTASNGKLKASEWHSLFAKHLPLVSLKAFGSVWSSGNHNRKLALLNNLQSLKILVPSLTLITRHTAELLRHSLRGIPSDQIIIMLFTLASFLDYWGRSSTYQNMEVKV
ncbi:hypothetical protein VP01_9104g1, partial [Puccinia sorghi]